MSEVGSVGVELLNLFAIYQNEQPALAVDNFHNFMYWLQDRANESKKPVTQQPTPEQEWPKPKTTPITANLTKSERNHAPIIDPKQEQPGSFEETFLQLVYGVGSIESLRDRGTDDWKDAEYILQSHNSTLEAAKREAVREVLERLKAKAGPRVYTRDVKTPEGQAKINGFEFALRLVRGYVDAELANLPDNNAVTKGESK